MMKKLLAAVSVFLVLFSVNVYAQHTVMRTPGKYLMPMDNASAAIAGARMSEGDLWVVFSDRPDNPVYSDRNCRNATGAKLDFMQAMYVVEETENTIKVVDYEQVDFRGNLKDGAASQAVWVPKDNMLLWRTSLKTRDVNLPEFRDGIFNKKAMVLNIISGNTNEIRVPEIYSHPRCNPSDSINSALVYQINYVFKETPTAYLIADISDIQDVEREAQYIKGWVLKSQTTAWNHRLALEVNWDAVAVEERKAKGIRANIKDQKTGGNIIFQEPQGYYRQRDIGEVDRFPVLDVYNSMTQVGVIGDLQAEDGRTLSSHEFAEIKHVIDSMSASLRNVNIMFVVDATSSMIPYVKSIQDAITTTMRRDLARSQNNYRFGALLYRDAAEGSTNMANDTRELTSNWNTITNFFSRFMIPQYNRHNTDTEEAVFYGIKRAIERFNPPAGESNYIVLIGDAGNHNRRTYVNADGQEVEDPTYVEEDELVSMLADKNINLISYQVQHMVTQAEKPAHDAFRTQIENLIKKSTAKRMNGTSEIDESQILTRSGDVATVKSELGIPGFLRRAPEGGRIHPNILVNELGESLMQVDEQVNNQLINISEFLNGKVSREHAMGIGTFIQRLEEQNISSDKLNIVFQKNGQQYNIGYTHRFVDGLKNPLFQDVLLMSHDDIFNIKRALDRLIPTDAMSLSPNESRGFIIFTWADILVDILGYFPEPNEAIDTLSLYTLSAILTGWGGKDKYRDIMLRDVSRQDLFPDLMLYEYLIDWCITKGHIHSIFEGQNILTADFFNDHKWTIFYEYLYNLSDGQYEEDEEMIDRFHDFFKQYDAEYSNFKSTFRTPMGTGSGMKHYWIDSRIFPHQIETEGEVDIIDYLFKDYMN